MRKFAQIPAGDAPDYASDMTEMEIVAENLRRLLAHAKDYRLTWPSSFKALEKMSGVDRRTVHRTIYCKTAPGIDVLGMIAAPFGLEAWQLLVRGMDPARPPRVNLTELRHVKAANARRANNADPAPVAASGKAGGAAGKRPAKSPGKRAPPAPRVAPKAVAQPRKRAL